MNGRPQWFLVGALLAAAVLAAMILGVRKPGESPSQAPTSYSPAPYGTRAFFSTLERLGYRPQRWRLDWSRLKREKGVLLYAPSDRLTARGQYRPLTASAAQDLSRWVERGNTLLYFLDPGERERRANVLLDQIGLSLRFEPLPLVQEHAQTLRQLLPTRPERDFDNILPVPWTVGVQRVTTDAGSAFVADKGHAVILTETGEYGPVIWIPYGEGRIYLFSSAGFIDNRFLARADNLTLALDILDRERGEDGAVLFDEYHHGFSDEFGVANFTQLPLVRFAALQAVLLLMLYLIVSWHRFGTPVPLVRDTRRSIREYTQSLGNLYLRAGTHREALEFLFRELRQDLCSRYNLPVTAPHTLVEDKLRVQRGAAETWRELATNSDRLFRRRRIADRDMVAMARRIEELRRRIA